MAPTVPSCGLDPNRDLTGSGTIVINLVSMKQIGAKTFNDVYTLHQNKNR